jgi:soluble lytic murein transglycosylase-like protein
MPAFCHIHAVWSAMITALFASDRCVHSLLHDQKGLPMKLLLTLASLAALMVVLTPEKASAQRAEYNELVARHARANGVPEELVHRVIVRESRYRHDVVGRGGTIGLMQIKLATARGVGYTGTAEGLRDPDTNLTYAVKYLAGAYRAANGDHHRAIAYYANGYYGTTKRQRLEHTRHPKSAFAASTRSRQPVP